MNKFKGSLFSALEFFCENFLNETWRTGYLVLDNTWFEAEKWNDAERAQYLIGWSELLIGRINKISPAKTT